MPLHNGDDYWRLAGRVDLVDSVDSPFGATVTEAPHPLPREVLRGFGHGVVRGSLPAVHRQTVTSKVQQVCRLDRTISR